MGISSWETQAAMAQGLELLTPRQQEEVRVAETTGPLCLDARHSPPIHVRQCPGREPSTTYGFLHHPPFGCP